jgi:hypothetical protein
MQFRANYSNIPPDGPEIADFKGHKSAKKIAKVVLHRQKISRCLLFTCRSLPKILPVFSVKIIQMVQDLEAILTPILNPIYCFIRPLLAFLSAFPV